MTFRSSLSVLLVVTLALAGFSPVIAGEPACDCSFKEVKHQGWKALESKRFRLHYSGEKATVEPLVQLCEESCHQLRSRWIANTRAEWSCKCEVYLYPDAKSFEKGARAPAIIRGVTDLEIGEGKVWKRRLDVLADDSDKLRPVMIHELTHIVLAEYFSKKPIPRWADEGIAVFSEPRERQQMMLVRLKEEAQMKRLLPLRQIASLPDAPTNEREGELYYGQSGAVIEYLVTHHKLSEKDVLAFVEQCGHRGWDAAVTKTLPGTTPAKFETEWKTWLLNRQDPYVALNN